MTLAMLFRHILTLAILLTAPLVAPANAQ
ncbi:MAG: hypothetical protein RL490_61, partial [Pseudomonadota bacterium]